VTTTQQSADITDALTDLSLPSVAVDAMHTVFGMVPHPWQEKTILHTIALAKNNACAPLLLVRPTGGGKSAVRDTVGVILAGVTLTISPLLSLAADQNDKVAINASQHFGNVVSFHLDEIRDINQQHSVAATISNLSSTTTQTIFLFASPQAFVNNLCWRNLLDTLIQKQLL
jgi:superfamily II DNA helicase RecQ